MATKAGGIKANPPATPRGIPVTTAADTLGELLNRVAFGREHIVITKNGKPVAKLVPVDSAA